MGGEEQSRSPLFFPNILNSREPINFQNWLLRYRWLSLASFLMKNTFLETFFLEIFLFFSLQKWLTKNYWGKDSAKLIRLEPVLYGEVARSRSRLGFTLFLSVPTKV